jgi:hypothetical protein
MDRFRAKLERAAKAIKTVKEHGIPFERLSDYHYRIGEYDFWPTKEKFINRKNGKEGRGTLELIRRITQSEGSKKAETETCCRQCERLERMKKDARAIIVGNDIVVMTRGRYVEMMKQLLRKQAYERNRSRHL